MLRCGIFEKRTGQKSHSRHLSILHLEVAPPPIARLVNRGLRRQSIEMEAAFVYSMKYQAFDPRTPQETESLMHLNEFECPSKF